MILEKFPLAKCKNSTDHSMLAYYELERSDMSEVKFSLSKIFRARRHLNLLIEIFLALILSPVSSIAAEGTIGWRYMAYPAHGFDLLYAATPIEACQNSGRPGGWRGMAGLAPHSNGTVYDCWLKPYSLKDQPLQTLGVIGKYTPIHGGAHRSGSAVAIGRGAK